MRSTPPKEDRHTLLFSATFTDDVMRLSEQWTDKPVKLEMEPERVATDTVEQKIYITTASEKFAPCCKIFLKRKMFRALWSLPTVAISVALSTSV